MLNTFEKTKAHEARRAAIQRQMEAMEAAASSRNLQNQQASGTASTTARRRTNQGSSDPGAPAGSLETARRFLWDEDDEDAIAGSETTIQAPTKGGRPAFNDDNRSSYSSNPKSSSGRFFNAFSGIFGGKQASSGQSRTQTSKMTNVNLNDASSVRAASAEDEYRPSLLTSSYIFFRHLMLACALSVGSCYMWLRTRASLAFINGRGRRLCLVVAIILVVVIPVAIFVPKSGSTSTTASVGASQRLDTISSYIVQGGISTDEELNTDGTPQRQALEWIVSEDPVQLDPGHPYLTQRYALAVFYYTTHGDGMYRTAIVNITETIPPRGGTTPGINNGGLPAEGESQVIGDDLAAQPNWINETGWMTGTGICSWHGIECHHRPGMSVYDTSYDANNGVILFNMTENNVRGKFPKEILAALTDIRWMSLSGNGFFGSIPVELGKLTELRYMSLSNNFLSGTVPSEITNLGSLNRLYIDGNYFRGTLPSNIGSMSQLVSLSIYNNYFSGAVPATMENLQNLTALYLDINHLTGTLPSGLGKLTRLVDLRLRHNRFVGTIPDEYGKLSRLEILYLDRNTLTGTIPTNLGKLTRINELHMYRNNIKGSIPTEVGLLRALASLYLDNNHLTGGIPTEFGHLNDLEQIYLHKNYMNGTIPTEIGQMENLRNFRVYTNGLKGTIPTEIGNAFKLEYFYVQDNLLQGTLPKSVAELTRLEKVRLYWNHLKGSVPAEVCSLTKDKLSEFKADCAGDPPEMPCSCCTACFV